MHHLTTMWFRALLHLKSFTTQHAYSKKHTAEFLPTEVLLQFLSSSFQWSGSRHFTPLSMFPPFSPQIQKNTEPRNCKNPLQASASMAKCMFWCTYPVWLCEASFPWYDLLFKNRSQLWFRFFLSTWTHGCLQCGHMVHVNKRWTGDGKGI